MWARSTSLWSSDCSERPTGIPGAMPVRLARAVLVVMAFVALAGTARAATISGTLTTDLALQEKAAKYETADGKSVDATLSGTYHVVYAVNGPMRESAAQVLTPAHERVTLDERFQLADGDCFHDTGAVERDEGWFFYLSNGVAPHRGPGVSGQIHAGGHQTADAIQETTCDGRATASHHTPFRNFCGAPVFHSQRVTTGRIRATWGHAQTAAGTDPGCTWGADLRIAGKPTFGLAASAPHSLPLSQLLAHGVLLNDGCQPAGCTLSIDLLVGGRRIGHADWVYSDIFLHFAHHIRLSRAAKRLGSRLRGKRV